MRKLILRAAGVALLVCGAATSAYATDPTAKWCQGVKIAAFPGGPQGGVFANNVYNGYPPGRARSRADRSPITSRTGIPTRC